VPAGSLLEGGVLGGTGCANVLVFSGHSIRFPPANVVIVMSRVVCFRSTVAILFIPQTDYLRLVPSTRRQATTTTLAPDLHT
jgi:hypothetical protein